ncbi:MAG: hypothetical protein ACRDHW_16045, partial [Ktedonobacteraceae bacterium]
MLSHDAALTYLIAQHTQEQAAAFLKQEIVTVKVSMSPTPSKKLIAKGEPALVHSKPGLPGITMPDRGTLDARAFLKAILNAGRRQSETGAMFTDALEVRNDQIKAIHAFFYETRNGVKVYVGYSPTGSFGSQEVAARALAMREIKGAPSVSHLPP